MRGPRPAGRASRAASELSLRLGEPFLRRDPLRVALRLLRAGELDRFGEERPGLARASFLEEHAPQGRQRGYQGAMTGDEGLPLDGERPTKGGLGHGRTRDPDLGAGDVDKS